MDEPEAEREYDSGPFCRHFGDPADCDIKCATCDHRCARHGADDGDSACYEGDDEKLDCPCLKWAEPPDDAA